MIIAERTALVRQKMFKGRNCLLNFPRISQYESEIITRCENVGVIFSQLALLFGH